MRLKLQEGIKQLTKRTIGIVIIYTVLWSILAGLILFIFHRNGRSFLWQPDGLYQHFASFGYLCDYLGDLIRNFHFSGFFNFTLGQGMDVLTTLNSYNFTDPISILCAFVLPLSRTGRYTLMIFIKLYLIGISFLFYCHVTERNKGMATIGGAIAYVFCGAVLWMLARDPNFINWAYFFPFLLGGVELYFRKKEKLPLILFVFLNLITSYYTFYMNAVLVAIYVLVFAIYKAVKERKWSVLREELIKCLKLAGVCCIGILLSAFILFPTIYAYLNNNRIGELTGYTASSLLYEDWFYKNSFEDFFAPLLNGGHDSYIGINVVLIIPLILLFTKRRQYTEMKALFLISLVMLGIPLVGRIMNGFGYASNRWAYAIPFYASVIFVIMFDEIKVMTEKEQAVILLTMIAYVTLCFLHTETNENTSKLSTMIMLIAVVAIVCIALRYKYPAVGPLILTLVFIGAGFSVYFTFSEHEGNYVSEYQNNAEVYSSYTNVSSTAVAESTTDDDFYRIGMEERKTNVNGENGVNGTTYWWSMVSGDMMDYHTDLALDTIITNCSSEGFDQRTGLLELASVKYYTRPNEGDGAIPYGYKEIESKDTRYQIFENTLALPIGYTYTNYISASDYETLNGIEKEQALMQGAVLDQDLEDFTKKDVQTDYSVLDYNVSTIEGVTWEDNCIKPIDGTNNDDVSREISLLVNVPDNCEIYVYIAGGEVGAEETDRLTVTATRTMGEHSISKYA